MKRLLVLLALGAAACNAPAPEPGGAALALNLTLETPRYQASAAAVTDPTQYQPTSLRMLVCENIELTETVTVFCRYDAGDFNYAETRDIPEGAREGTLSFGGIPPAKNQVVVVQGMVGELLTYQGYTTMETIEPRAEYTRDVTLRQVYFPPLPAPAIPVISSPWPSPATASPNAATIVITGTRELDTMLRVTGVDAFRIGNPKYLSGNLTESYYKENESGGKLNWELTLTIPGTPPRATMQSFKLGFAAARDGDTLYSQEQVLVVKACGTDNPDC